MTCALVGGIGDVVSAYRLYASESDLAVDYGIGDRHVVPVTPRNHRCRPRASARFASSLEQFPLDLDENLVRIARRERLEVL